MAKTKASFRVHDDARPGFELTFDLGDHDEIELKALAMWMGNEMRGGLSPRTILGCLFAYRAGMDAIDHAAIDRG